jgi:hypothetical protein
MFFGSFISLTMIVEFRLQFTLRILSSKLAFLRQIFIPKIVRPTKPKFWLRHWLYYNRIRPKVSFVLVSN